MSDLTLEEATILEAKLLIKAFHVQNACNLSGVVKSFADDISQVWRICRAYQQTD